MPLELIRREKPSGAIRTAAPVLAVVLTMAAGALIFTLLGFDGLSAVWAIFIHPLLDSILWGDLIAKAAPLLLISIGLSIGFRANVWNIGAEGQFIAGGLAGTGVALATWGMEGVWILPLMCLAGALGGAAWAAIPALLRTRLGVSEILSSLMLTYAAVQLLYYLMNGPWKDPSGFNFPETRLFTDAQTLPHLDAARLIHLDAPIALGIAFFAWFAMGRSLFGFRIRAIGAAPRAARFAGFSSQGAVWTAMLLSGALAGLAGIFHASGAVGQMVPQFPVGYGFTAIIVAFLGRLHPLGIVFASLALAISYVGGDEAQAMVGLPSAAAGLIQALLLFFLLATDIFATHRPRLRRRSALGA